MPVRTKVLGKAVSPGVAGQDVLVYTCPPGETAIIKQVAASELGVVTRAILSTRSGPNTVQLIDEPNLSGGRRISGLFHVLEPGDTVRWFSLGAQASVWISGAELEGTAD